MNKARLDRNRDVVQDNFEWKFSVSIQSVVYIPARGPAMVA